MVVLDTIKLTKIFIECDEFCKELDKHLLSDNLSNSPKCQQMTESEMMAVVIFYHVSGFRCFAWYYETAILNKLNSYFPKAYSYSRFVELMPRLNLYLFSFLVAARLSCPTEANYIDSTKLIVCHIKRRKKHKTFQNFAKSGKTSVGWFFGFKLHAIVNQYGQLVIFRLTTGNIADNNAELLESMTQKFRGLLIGDKGYLTKIAQTLKEKGIELITRVRDNMAQQSLTPMQKYYLRYRGIIEACFHLLKDKLNLEHTRHRSTKNFIINIWAALLAYSFLDKHPFVTPYQFKLNANEIVLS